MKNAITWFDLPARDIHRAVQFYNEILQVNMSPMQTPDGWTAFFPYDAPLAVGGAITTSSFHTPSDSAGTVVFLDAGDDLSVVLERIEPAGGKVIMPKTNIGEWGYTAFFIDCEGNRVGLHSNN